MGKVLENLNEVLEIRQQKLKNNRNEANRIIEESIYCFENLDVTRVNIILCKEDGKIIIDSYSEEEIEHSNLIYPKLIFDIIIKTLQSEEELKEKLSISYNECNILINLV